MVQSCPALCRASPQAQRVLAVFFHQDRQPLVGTQDKVVQAPAAIEMSGDEDRRAAQCLLGDRLRRAAEIEIDKNSLIASRAFENEHVSLRAYQQQGPAVQRQILASK